MIKPRKDYRFKDIDDVILIMGAHDWKIISFDNRSNFYTPSKEILLDNPSWELYIEKLKNLETKLK